MIGKKPLRLFVASAIATNDVPLRRIFPDRAVTYEDKAKLFRVTAFLAVCRMEARVVVPSIGFIWRSDPIDRCPPAAFAVIGSEINGKYYDEAAAR